MKPVFDAYSRYYDLLYRDKDYESEANFIAEHIKNQAPKANRILELGCGTGAHAEYLAKMGFSIHGVDLSNPMLAKAQARHNTLPPDVAKRLSFERGDIRKIRINQTFDTIISLFHVMSYQTKNDDLIAAFETAATHLNPGGIFLFDFWYGPAVLTEKPEIRVRRMRDENFEVIRIAEPTMHPNDNIVDVNFSVIIKDNKINVTENINESHSMRYLFIPELEYMLSNLGFQICLFGEWLTANKPNLKTWNAYLVAIKK